MTTPPLELKNITKSFGKVSAVDHVDMTINKGEIIGLIGDNGAGKSTFVKVISGVHTPDSGEIYVRGQKAQNWSVTKAREAGIETVYQDKALAVQQTIIRNIFMGREMTNAFGFMKTKKQYAEQAKDFSREQVLRLLKVMFDAESRIRYSSNQKILFEALIVELCDLNKEVVDISKLISELDALKKKTKLSSGSSPAPVNTAPISSSSSSFTEQKEEKDEPAPESQVVKKLKELFDVERFNTN